MKLKLKLTLLAALAALSLLAADTPKQESKKADAPAPVIHTAKLWRLVAAAQSARAQANQTPQAKAADAADLEVQKEQERLAGICGADFVLGMQEDAKAENAGDVICKKRPAPQKVDPPASAKEK
jgi:hypothetical protein